MGNSDYFSDFNYHHSNILTKSQLKVLLEHVDSKKTIGIAEASHDTLYELPRPLFTIPIVIDRLEQVYQNQYFNGNLSCKWFRIRNGQK